MIPVKCLYTVYICTLNPKFNLKLPLFVASMMDLVRYQEFFKKESHLELNLNTLLKNDFIQNLKKNT